MRRYQITQMSVVPLILKALEERIREKLDALPSQSDAAVSATWWRSYKARNDSRVVDCFAGQLRSETTCGTCRARSRASPRGACVAPGSPSSP